MQERKVWKAVVCGTGFGMFYIEAIKHLPEEFELVGIVAKGSERSRKCAESYGVKIYNTVAEVPEDVDLACVAIRSSSLGGSGTDMTVEFLNRGINVILEQPVHHDDLKLCFKTAQKNKCCFMTGDLYMNMPEIRRFLQICHFMKTKGEKIEYIKAGSCVQAFYPFVEIFNQLVSGSEITINDVGEQMGGFKQITGMAGDIPFSFQFNNSMNPQDPDNHMQILHNFCCYYQSGRLELVDSRGPLIWYQRMNMPWSILKDGVFPETYPEHMLAPNMEILTPDLSRITKPYYQIALESWTNCISMDLQKIRKMSGDRKKFIIKAQQEQKASRLWNDLTQKFGYASLNSSLDPKTISLEELKSAGVLPEERKNIESE